MRLTIFGGSGYVGQAVVKLALERGHQLTLFVHHSAPFTDSKQLRTVRGDARQGEHIQQSLDCSEAVISTLGSLRGPAKDVLSSAVQQLVPAMNQAGIKRIVSLTGYSAFAASDQPSRLDRWQHSLLNSLAPRILRDAEQHLRLLVSSDLAWSVLRAPVIIKYGGSSYHLDASSPPKPWQSIPRQAVATALIDLAESQDYVRKAPFITRR